MRRKSVRAGACALVLALTAGMLPPGLTGAAVYAENGAGVDDLLQLVADDGEKTVMQLYAGGLYEAQLSMEAGSHTLSLYRNGADSGLTDQISVPEDGTVMVRYQSGELTDSVNEPEQYHTAALTGNFEGLVFKEESGTEYSIASWDPADENGELDYAGGGIYRKTFLIQPPEEEVTLQDGGYKVAFDDSWDYSLGDGEGNISLTVPAGTESFTVFVDEANGAVYDSVRTAPLSIYQNAGSVTAPAFETAVSLIGTVRQDEAVNWDASAQGYDFTQISEKLYLYQQVLDKGSYEYKAVFDHSLWYESYGGGNKTLTVEEDGTNVIFLYDVESDRLYDSCNDYNITAQKLGFEAVPAEAEVRDNANGTTTFVMTGQETDEVVLHYADRETGSFTEAAMTKGTDAAGNFDQSFVSEDLFLGDGELDYIYYYTVNGEKVLDPSAAQVTVDEEQYSEYTRDAFSGRLVCVPGTFPGPSWDAASNVMTYEGNGRYSYTFEDVPPANYEFKISMGSWDENYGTGGKRDGSNYGITVPEKMDVTVYYSDLSHLAVTDIDYVFADIRLEGSGIPEGTKLTDEGLTGIYSTSVALEAGTYDDLKLFLGEQEYPVDAFTLERAKTVTFYFDPATEIYYNNASDEVLDESRIYYDSRDTGYKSIYGAIPTDTDVTFSLVTGEDARKASLVIQGAEKKTLAMNGEKQEDGSVKWSVTTQFAAYGAYTYYFVAGGESSISIYCDDDGYYGTGMVTDLTRVLPYEMNVYQKDYTTPDWMKNAVIYQIFPDRFFNGDSSNDRAQTQSRGDTEYEFIEDWYTLPENPDQQTLNPDTYPENAWWGDGVWNNEIYGGDLEGITERIDYLKALGVNVIYLNPVFSSISSHRYDASDYSQIDPILGTLGDFTELVETAEENGMHVVLDGVFNHVADDSVYFDRYYRHVGEDGKVGAYPYWAYVYDYMAEQGAGQPEAEAAARAYFEEKGVTDFTYTQWFDFTGGFMTDDEGNPVTDTIGWRSGRQVYAYDCWWGYDSMPVIIATGGSEYQTPGWADEIIDGENSVAQYWLEQGSDGWRLDVANEVSDETWQKFRSSVKSLSSENVIIGEIWDDASEYLLGDMYDSVMNYVFRDAVIAYAKGGSAADSVSELEKLRERYPQEAFYAMMNLVGSHDTARVLSALDGIEDDRKQTDTGSAFPARETTSELAKERQYLVSFIQMTYPGAPTIYYGDELGMTGADDPDDRRAMEWGMGDRELTEWYAYLAAVRNSYSALRTGTIEPVEEEDSDHVMAYVRKDDDAVLYVAANNSTDETRQAVFQAAAGAVYTDLITGETWTADENGVLTADVEPLSGVILTEEVREAAVDYEALAPAYDASYICGNTGSGAEDPETEGKEETDGPGRTEDTENENAAGTQGQNSGKTDAADGKAVQTGDGAQVQYLCMLLAVSGILAYVIGTKRKNRNL